MIHFKRHSSFALVTVSVVWLGRSVSAAAAPSDPASPTGTEEPTTAEPEVEAPATAEPDVATDEPTDEEAPEPSPVSETTAEPRVEAMTSDATSTKVVSSSTSPPSPSAAAAAKTTAEPVSPLIPAGELDRMAPRPIGSGVFTPGKGIEWKTADGRFSLSLGVAMQFLYTFNDAHPRVLRAQNTSQMFEIRRARLMLQGNLFSEHVKYYLQAQFSPRDLGVVDGQITQSPVFLGYATFDRIRDFTVQVGQQWIPYSHQRVAPIMKLQMIDFSLASAEFGLERDIGVDFLSKNFLGLDRLRYHVGVFMGEGVQYTKPGDIGMIYNGRLEVLPFGDFDDYPEVDFNRRLKPKMAISAAYAFDHADKRTKAVGGTTFADGGNMDAHNATADVIFKIAGVSLLGDFWFRYSKRNGGGLTDPTTNADIPIQAARNGIGGTAQAGFLIPRAPFEIAGRYSGVRPLGTSSMLQLNEAGPGLSYYFAEHSCKLQLDYFHGWGEREVRTDRVRLQLTVTF